jgi:hypothetical protein
VAFAMLSKTQLSPSGPRGSDHSCGESGTSVGASTSSLGLGPNSRLKKIAAPLQEKAKRRFLRTNEKARLFSSTRYGNWLLDEASEQGRAARRAVAD